MKLVKSEDDFMRTFSKLRHSSFGVADTSTNEGKNSSREANPVEVQNVEFIHHFPSVLIANIRFFSQSDVMMIGFIPLRS